jgi:hypothetical protein
MVAKDLPDSSPAKVPAVIYAKLYEDKYGPGTLSGLGANAYDAWLIIQNAARRLQKSPPSRALRNSEKLCAMRSKPPRASRLLAV